MIFSQLDLAQGTIFLFIFFIFLLLFSDCFSGEWLVLEKSGAENRYFKTTESVYKNKRKKKI